MGASRSGIGALANGKQMRPSVPVVEKDLLALLGSKKAITSAEFFMALEASSCILR